MRAFVVALGLVALCVVAQPPVKPLPPPGIAVPANERTELEDGLAKLKAALDAGKGKAAWADAAIFHKAVRWALDDNLFYNANEFSRAKEMLRIGLERASELDHAPWRSWTGLVPLAYVSRLDDSLQPYGLVVPESWSPKAKGAWRLDVWFHGRGETLSELAFLHQRLNNAGEFTPPDTFVLHLYGRYCNANKLAGEVDLFEALDDVKKRYRIDPDRISMRGFSMGGAAAWHFGAHHAGAWASVAPGAGFSETEEFLKITPEQKKAQYWWETKLWNWYDATQYAANFFNVPLVAYSGEIDGQRQAARAMERMLAKEGLTMTHVIGPQTGHKYHPDSKVEINRRLDAIVQRGRVVVPRKIRFTTFTLRYPRMKWLAVDGLDEHWERSRVDAELRDPSFVTLRTENVNAVTLTMGPGEYPFDPTAKPTVTINGFPVQVPGCETDLSWKVSLYRDGQKWVAGARPAALRKTPLLQGPIDDAFMGRFLFVRPTGTPADAKAHAWSLREMAFAQSQWHKNYRGDVRIKDDKDVTDADIADSHLVLWGDAGSNSLWARVNGSLPVKAGSGQVVQMIYPNPLNQKRYVVLNSGFTYREEANANNARQIPMLPDWVLIDAASEPGPRYPGRILEGGFFDEEWKLKTR